MPRPFTADERDRIRAALLRAAREAGVHRGFRRLPVEELCRAAGISKGAFYLFFDSREQLFLELLQQTEQEVRTALAEAARTRRLDALIDALSGAITRHPLLAALADPEEWAWLERALPPGFLAAAHADDLAHAAHLLAALEADRTIRPGLRPEEWVGMGGTLLALHAKRAMLGEAVYQAALAHLRRAWTADLQPR